MKEIRFDSRQSHKISFCTTASKVALEPFQLPMQWMPEAVFLEVKRPGVEVTTHRLVQRFRLRGPTIPLPTHVFVSCLTEDRDCFILRFTCAIHLL